MKKFRAKIALIVVLSLALAAAIPALAANTTKITGKYEATTIEVVIPTTATAVINPLGIPVTVYADDGKSELGTIGKGDSVITRPLVGYNASKLDLKIGANVVGTEKGALKLGTAAGTDKTVKIEFQVMANTYGTAADIWYYDIAQMKTNMATALGQLNGAFVVNAIDEATDWTSAETVAVKNTTDAPNGTNLTNPVSVKKGVEKTNSSGKTEVQPDRESLFYARLTGTAAKYPEDAAGKKTPWATTDGVDVTIAWTIEADTTT